LERPQFLCFLQRSRCTLWYWNLPTFLPERSSLPPL